MSIYVNLFDNKDKNINVSKPTFNMDIGYIALGDADNDDPKKYKKISRVYKSGSTSGTARPKQIWPNHDLYRFGLVTAKDLTAGHSMCSDDSDTPVNYTNFYPTVTDNYVLWTDPDQCTINLGLRTCKYRYNGIYLLEIELIGSFLSQFGNVTYNSSTDMGYDNTTNSPDMVNAVVCIKQTVNPSFRTFRTGYIIIRQYRLDESNNKRYTGKVINIEVNQHPDELDLSTLKYDSLKWYSDKNCTTEKSDYGPALGTGGYLDTYFRIVGSVKTGTGRTIECFFGELADITGDSLDDIDVEVNTDSDKVTSGSLDSLGNGVFHIRFDYASNVPEGGGFGGHDLTIDFAGSGTSVAWNATSGSISFTLSNTVESDPSTGTVKVFYKGSAFPNTASIGQASAQGGGIITDLFWNTSGTDVSATVDDTSLITIKDVDYNISTERIVVNFSVNSKNEGAVSYSLNDWKCISSSTTVSSSHNSVSGSDTPIKFTCILKKSIAATSSKSFKITVTCTSTDFGNASNYIDMSQGVTGGGAASSSVVNCTTSTIVKSASFSDSGISGAQISADGGDASGKFTISVKIPNNPKTTTGAGTVSGWKRLVKSGSSYVDYSNQELPVGGESSGSATYYIGFDYTTGESNSSERTTSFTFSVTKVDGITTSLSETGSVRQEGSTDAQSSVKVTDATFTIKNETDNIESSNIGYNTTAGKYIYPIRYQANSNFSSTGTASGNYSISQYTLSGYNTIDNAAIASFYLTESVASDQVVSRSIKFVLVGYDLDATFTQAGGTYAGSGTVSSSDSIVILTEDQFYAQLSVTASPGDVGCSDFVNTIGIESDGEIVLYLSATNNTLRETTDVLQGLFDRNWNSMSSWSSSTSQTEYCECDANNEWIVARVVKSISSESDLDKNVPFTIKQGTRTLKSDSFECPYTGSTSTSTTSGITCSNSKSGQSMPSTNKGNGIGWRIVSSENTGESPIEHTLSVQYGSQKITFTMTQEGSIPTEYAFNVSGPISRNSTKCLDFISSQTFKFTWSVSATDGTTPEVIVDGADITGTDSKVYCKKESITNGVNIIAYSNSWPSASVSIGTKTITLKTSPATNEYKFSLRWPNYNPHIS